MTTEARAVESKTLTLNGLRFHYLDWGRPRPDAQTMVCLHGFSSHAHSWDTFAEAMRERYHVLALDQRGHGLTEWATDYHAQRRVEDMQAFQAALNLDHFVLVGLSMGGYIAFEMLRQAPERIAAAAFLDTSARPDTAEQTERRHALIRIAEAGGLDRVAELQFPLMVDASRLEDAALKAAYGRMVEETGADAFVRQQKAIMSRPDSRPDLGRIACPALALVGDGDQATPPELAREIAAGIPGAELAVIERCGHLSTLERPAEVSGRLRDWLNRI